MQPLDSQDMPWWLSTARLRTTGPDTAAAGRTILGRLIAEDRQAAGPLEEGENPGDFYAWLLATSPQA